MSLKIERKKKKNTLCAFMLCVWRTLYDLTCPPSEYIDHSKGHTKETQTSILYLCRQLFSCNDTILKLLRGRNTEGVKC